MQHKLRVFLWLLLKDRLNTKDLMVRKNWHIEDGPNCVLCAASVLETSDHLFFECGFARAAWEEINIVWNLNLSMAPRCMEAKRLFTGPCFIEIIACAAWNIWKMRNDCIFRNQNPSLGRWRVLFQSDLMLHKYRVKDSLVQPLIEWIIRNFA